MDAIANRDTCKYHLKDGRRVVHRGITNDLERRVYVRMGGPEYVSDDDLLLRALVREEQVTAEAVGAGWASIGIGAGERRGQGVRVRQPSGV